MWAPRGGSLRGPPSRAGERYGARGRGTRGPEPADGGPPALKRFNPRVRDASYAAKTWSVNPSRSHSRGVRTRGAGASARAAPRPAPGACPPGARPVGAGRADRGRADQGRADRGRADIDGADHGRAGPGRPSRADRPTRIRRTATAPAGWPGRRRRADGGRRGPAQRVVKAPPLTWRVWPVMWRAPGEARKKAVSAMSSGRPGRLSCVSATSAACRCSVSAPWKKLVSAM